MPRRARGGSSSAASPSARSSCSPNDDRRPASRRSPRRRRASVPDATRDVRPLARDSGRVELRDACSATVSGSAWSRRCACCRRASTRRAFQGGAGAREPVFQCASVSRVGGGRRAGARGARRRAAAADRALSNGVVWAARQRGRPAGVGWLASVLLACALAVFGLGVSAPGVVGFFLLVYNTGTLACGRGGCARAGSTVSASRRRSASRCSDVDPRRSDGWPRWPGIAIPLALGRIIGPGRNLSRRGSRRRRRRRVAHRPPAGSHGRLAAVPRACSLLHPHFGGSLMPERRVQIVNTQRPARAPRRRDREARREIPESTSRSSKDGLEVNGKSIMGVMMLAAEYGSRSPTRRGPGRGAAVDALATLVGGKFGETLSGRKLTESPRRRESSSVTVHLLRWEVPEVPQRIIPDDAVPREIARFHDALDRAKERLRQMRDGSRKTPGRRRRRSSTSSVSILEDRELIAAVEALIAELRRGKGVRDRDARVERTVRARRRTQCSASGSAISRTCISAC